MKSFSALSAAGRGVARQDGRRLCAPGAASRPRDRHTRASLGVVNLEARPGPAAAHRHRVCLVSIRFRVVDLEAWLGPAAAHRHRGLALLWSLRHYANPNSADRPRGGLQSVGVVVCVLPALAL